MPTVTKNYVHINQILSKTFYLKEKYEKSFLHCFLSSQMWKVKAAHIVAKSTKGKRKKNPISICIWFKT